MSRGLNKLMIIGHLGRDPEMRYTPSGKPVTTFSVATSRTWHSADGERHKDTEWFNVVAWGDWLRYVTSIFIKECRFTLKVGCRPDVGKTQRGINISQRSLLPRR